MLDRLVREHLAATVRFAVRLTGDVDVADDVVQDALLRATRAFKNFRGDSGFKTWLFSIVVNVFRTRMARRPAAAAISEDFPDQTADDPGSAAQTSELAALIARHVSALPPRQREALVLIAFEGFSPRATAECLSVTEGNVRVQLHLARTALREKLACYLAEK